MIFKCKNADQIKAANMSIKTWIIILKSIEININ